jgi:putative Ca2+/H+ antiporter (TMEM165/GDT1 family)
MDALVPALVAALCAGIGDRPAWLAAILGDRYRANAAMLAGLVLALGGAAAVAALSATLILGVLSPNARLLMLALALLFAGVGCLMRTRTPDRLEGWRLGAFLTTSLGGFVLALGDRTAFLVFGLAAWGASPWLAAAGAAVGGLVIAVLAASLGEAVWRALPLRALSAAAGIAFLVLGTICALSALRLL